MIRTAICGLIVVFLWTHAAASPARAQQENLYTVENVKVDVTADSAVAARNQAFEEAQQAAFLELAGRLLPETALQSFTPPDASIISPMIQDFEITSENLSRVRYMGTYTFRFYSDAVSKFLKVQGVTYTDVGSKPVLILPFYQWGSRTILWDNNNPWMGAWARAGKLAQGLVPVAVPIGDLDDVSDMGDNDALTYKADHVARMVNRYNAGSAVITIATPEWQGASSPATVPDALNIALYRAEANGPRYLETIKVARAKDEAAASLLDNAVKTVRKVLQADWKTRTAVDPTQSGALVAQVRFRDMREWIETQKALRGVGGITDIKLQSLTSNEARIEIFYQGDSERLRLAMAQADLTLTAPPVADPYAAYTGTPREQGFYQLALSRYAPQGAQPVNSAPGTPYLIPGQAPHDQPYAPPAQQAPPYQQGYTQDRPQTYPQGHPQGYPPAQQPQPY